MGCNANTVLTHLLRSSSSSGMALQHQSRSVTGRSSLHWTALGPSGQGATLDIHALQRMSSRDKLDLRNSLDSLLAPRMQKLDARPVMPRHSVDSQHCHSGLISAFAGQPAFEGRLSPQRFDSRPNLRAFDSRPSTQATASRPSSQRDLDVNVRGTSLPNLQAEQAAMRRFAAAQPVSTRQREQNSRSLSGSLASQDIPE